MAIFSTKDYSPAKTAENKLAVGKKLGLGEGVEASKAQVEADIELYLRELRQWKKRIDYDAAFVADSSDA